MGRWDTLTEEDIIDQLKKSAKQLRALAQAVRKEARDYRVSEYRLNNSWRPAIHLPTETLSRIFGAACFASFNPFDFDSQMLDSVSTIRTTRNVIVSVCTRWREIALSTSSIWTSIVAHHQKTRRRRKTIATEFLNLNLLPLEIGRARGRP